MAKRKVNKTELVKAELEKNPGAKPAAIAATLKKYGISAAYVSTIKSNLGGKSDAKKKKPGRPKGSKAGVERVAVNDLVKAKKLADELGGVEKAKALLDAVGRLS